MNRTLIFSIALSLFLLLSYADLIQAQRAGSNNLQTDELRILSLINRERGHSGLASLSWNDRLADLARSYSKTMARDGFFAHIDRNGDSVVERARRYRIGGWRKIGENLFECESTDNFVGLALRGWMRSPSHRDNILDPVWRDTGIGIAYSRSGEIYITEIFSVN